VHPRVHVARVDGVDAQVGPLGGEHGRELLERRLRSAVAAPARVGLDGRVGRDVHDPAPGGQPRERVLDERERRDRVDAEDVLEDVDRVVGERRQRRRAERARVVDHELQALARDLDEQSAMPGVRDVARDRDDIREHGQLGAGGLELGLGAGVDDEAPAALCERPRERKAEAPRRTGDDGGAGHAASRRARAAAACS
jgi:hypothetical protein